MTKALAIALLAMTLVLGSGCAFAPTPAGVGVIYTDVTYAVDAEGGVGSRTGQAKATNILGIIASGDASITAAAANGGITNVSTVDVHVMSILGLFATATTTVTGS